ncbi:TonB-dependent receptor [Olivibacter ginsenosidimutans]|uniref:TonB-dependent receptor n=2 Tax=Olivibacter ginsenosidimutans TaxID=1176537 RepID=A0ABP9BXH9_9SPHI
MALTIPAFSQNGLISGRVVDKNGRPVVGATVLLKQQSTRGISDSLGKFQIHTTTTKGTLVVSNVGFISKEVSFSTLEPLQIVLQEDQTQLDEIVVVGYGKQKKVNLTGSVATISGDEIRETPTTNLMNAIGGRLPGAVTVNGNGRPGSGSSLQIRGFSTLNNNDPLYVVDGVVRTDGIGNLDAAEIESMSILKDASAAAVYGARAANGVVLVTTKRGALGKPVFSYSGLFGIQTPTQYPRMMNALEYATFRNAGLRNMGYDITNPAHTGMFYTDEEIDGFRNGGTDWYDLTFKKNSVQTQHSLTINGGSEAIRYFSALGYTDQDGMYDNINFKRYNLRTNVDTRINKRFQIGLNLEGRQEVSKTPGWDANQLFQYIQLSNPTLPAYTKSGRPFNTNGAHPVEMIYNSGYGNNQYSVFQGTLQLDHQLDFITEGLSIQGVSSYYKQHLFNKSFVMPHTMYEEDENGNITNTKVTGDPTFLTETFQEINNVTLNASLRYARTFGDHDLSGLMLFEQFKSSGNGFDAARRDFHTNIKDEFFASGPNNQTIGGSGIVNDARRSLVGRANYAFRGRYLFEGTFRYDGSYRFPEGRRFGFFPAFSAGWRLSEEGFFKNSAALGFVNDLKLRISKGVIGNDRVSAFQFMDAYTIVTGSGPIFDGQPQPLINYGVYPNPNITWEKQDNTNFGLDASLFNSVLGVEFDYYFRNTKDILWSRDRSVPATFGRGLPNENYAVVKSKGLEFTINHQYHIGQVNYHLRLTGSYASSKVTQIDDPANALDFQKQLGRPVGFLAGYQAEGIFQNQEEIDNWYGGTQFGYKPQPGDIRYADLDGDNRITISDQQVLSDYGATPRIMYGIAGGFSWRNIDLDFLFQGATQRAMFLSGTARVMYNNGSYNNFAYLDDAWSAENREGKYPEAWVGSNTINDRNSSLWLRNTGYIRLKTLNLGYTFRSEWLASRHIQRLKVFVSGYNLFTWSGFKEFDPEAETGGGWYYPQQRNINIGINASF